MQSLLGTSFLCKDAEVGFEEIEQSAVVTLYFTADWCPPCRIFTPVLLEFYNDANYPDKRLEIVQVSSDKDIDSFRKHVAHVPWLAIPFGDARLKALKMRYKVTGIPILLLLNRDGSVAHATARADVQGEGPDCFERWLTLVN